MAAIDDIIGSLEKLSVLELVELTKAIQDKWGVSAAPAAVAVAAAPAEAAAVVEEKTSFDVILKAIGEKKIQVIKVVREVTSLGLKEAKDLVDGAPQPVKTGLNKADAEKIKAQIEAEGATCEIV